MDIERLKPGHELDLLIAEKVMGEVPCDAWERFNSRASCLHEDSCNHKSCYPRDDPSRYSTNIAAVWMMVEKLIADGWTFELGHATGKDYSPWVAWLYNDKIDKLGRWGDTAPHAICLTALVAMEASD